jgi:hypothetical protein
MSYDARLARLEAAITGPGEGSDDLCPKCGGLTLEMLMREAEALDRDLPPHIRYAYPAEEPDAEGERITEAAREGAERKEAARCRRCGAPTLLALLAEVL